MLLDVLVALSVAAVVLGVLSRILASSWDRSRVPMDQVSALGVALNVIAESAVPGSPIARDGRIGRFAYTTSIAPLTIEPLPGTLAPPIERPDAVDKRQPAAGPKGVLQQLSIVITAPANRRLAVESIRLETPAR
ncbi:MAG TPA: hypothetical protein VGC77_14395 [Rhodopseudomonas sp.]|uniref:hypothetical protein n=1 Tax=Rhodopseudomonas sp. TaxID=1078 RepID=UPI002EDB79FE